MFGDASAFGFNLDKVQPSGFDGPDEAPFRTFDPELVPLLPLLFEGLAMEVEPVCAVVETGEPEDMGPTEEVLEAAAAV